MRSLARSTCLAACVLAATRPATAQQLADPRDALLVSTTWLAEHLEDPDLVVLHVGDDDDYAKAHIPGAYNVQMEDFAGSDRAPRSSTAACPRGRRSVDP